MGIEAVVTMTVVAVLVLAVDVAGRVVVVRMLIGLGLQRYDGGGVEDVAVAALSDCLVDRRLEALDVDDRIRVGDGRDLARRELDVVRLGARAGQALDTRVLTRDALGDELQRVERRDDLQLTRLGRRRLSGRSAAGWRKEEGAAGKDSTERAREMRHGNHFHLIENGFQLGRHHHSRTLCTYVQGGSIRCGCVQPVRL